MFESRRECAQSTPRQLRLRVLSEPAIVQMVGNVEGVRVAGIILQAG